MHIRLIEPGHHGTRIAIDVEGDIAAIVRRIVAEKYNGCIEAILFDWHDDKAILFNPAGMKEYRLEGGPARELREKLGVLYPALLL